MLNELRRGTFLISSPEIDTGIFFRSVILLCEYSPSGSFGIVINKSLNLDIPKDIMAFEKFANPNVQIRAGGPVQTNQMMLLHTHGKIPEQTMEVCEGVFLGGDLKFLQDMIAKEDGPQIHLCFGYAGWNSPQLEKEVREKSWFIYPATKELIFDHPPETLWQTLLRNMGGEYTTLSMIPEDLSLN